VRYTLSVQKQARPAKTKQIFKTSVAVSGTEREADLYGGKDLPYQRAKKATEHALDIERAFWFG